MHAVRLLKYLVADGTKQVLADLLRVFEMSDCLPGNP